MIFPRPQQLVKGKTLMPTVVTFFKANALKHQNILPSKKSMLKKSKPRLVASTIDDISHREAAVNINGVRGQRRR